VYKRGRTWTYHAHWTNADGTKDQRKRGGFRTKEAAARAEAVLLASVVHGDYVKPTKGLTVGEYLTGRWLPSRAGKVKPSTLATDRYLINAYVIPRLGSVELCKVDAAMLDGFYGALFASGRTGVTGPAGSGLSTKTVRNVAGLLHKAFRDAVRWRLIAHNPATEAEPPRRVVAEMRYWTPEQLRRFLGHVADDRFYAVWLLAATTGMRRGELLGLRWSDVNLTARQVRVVNTRVLAGAVVADGSPKTERGRRVIALDAATVAALRVFRKAQIAERLALGLAWDADGYVAAHPDSTPVYPKTFTQWFRAHCAAAGVPPIRLHDMRHTYATIAIGVARVPIKVVSQRLGHANVNITMGTYAHVLPGDDEAAADAAAAAILGPAR
jgi:integrase